MDTMAPTDRDSAPPPDFESEGRGAEPATILVVDDEPSARQLLTELLEAHGFRVVAVARGEAVFSWLSVVDLVVLDAMLPGRDGWSICREIRERHDPLLPIIMVTARTSPEDIIRTFEVGADDYVAKPFQAAEFIARIESRLRVHNAERALQQMNRRLADLANQNFQLYEKARKDADERALLLRELDHRVRNNLSIIMGLVSMERNRQPPRPADEMLASLEGRLRSFLIAYEALRRQSYRAVAAREIVERLTQRIASSRGMNGRIQVEVCGDSPTLTERQGYSVALALNELVTNALEHAFPEERSGTVRVRVEEDDGWIRIEIADDGVGMPETLCEAVLGSGRSIVDALIRHDLGGWVEYRTTGRGTRVLLSFPRES